jgi:hypothetical protein
MPCVFIGSISLIEVFRPHAGHSLSTPMGSIGGHARLLARRKTNIWLHQQVMAKLAESGGKMPESLARLIVESVPRQQEKGLCGTTTPRVRWALS